MRDNQGELLVISRPEEKTFKSMPEQVHEVLESFPIPSRDERKQGAFEIVKRTVTFDDGSPPRVYIERRLRIGERYLVLPRDIEQALLSAIAKGFSRGDAQYTALVEELNQKPVGRR